MEEASTKKNKTKPINIKNKKAVKATLAKASIKGKTTSAKSSQPKKRLRLSKAM